MSVKCEIYRLSLDGIYPRVIALLGFYSVQSMSMDRTIHFFFFFSRASSHMSTRKKATGSLEGTLRKEDHIVCGTT